MFLEIEYSDEIKKWIEVKTREYIEMCLAEQVIKLIDKSKSNSFEIDFCTSSFEYKQKYDEYWIAQNNRFFYEDSMNEYRRRLTIWKNIN